MVIILPPPSVVTAPIRMSYTAYKRHRAPDSLLTAVNAVALEQVYDGHALDQIEKSRSSSLASSVTTASEQTSSASRSSSLSSAADGNVELKETDNLEPPSKPDNELELTDSEFSNERLSVTASASRLIAVYPQYLARARTIISIREVDFPKCSSSFSVRIHPEISELSEDLPTGKDDGNEIFKINRERPSLTHRQIVIDSTTGHEILTVRQDLGTLPHSYRFERSSRS